MNQLMPDTARMLGVLDLATVQAIIKVIHSAHSISPKHKRAIETNLGSVYDLSCP
ncbi:MAG: hypothetical protein GTO55_01950 [Armatimonadetes bacterium]|nr:hypothetical protein [Armatimonadota bacterium]NIM66910.1 hypothetical protein [Armatimonadota bacterium]NIM75444.1 hypothetical protein [Armatimonadota bacterium]NIN05101.1 hypothetical protein [Armatimonadota bacterium]NIO76479.1 hypothetical protein [Armatimonadota bacterium]